MKKIINYITISAKYFFDFCQKYKYKLAIIGLFLTLGLFWGVDFVFATGSVDRTGSAFLLEFYLTLTIIIKFLSWFWVILANIAGGLLTNKRVTADGFGLTDTLFGYFKFFQSIAWITMVGLILKSIITDAVINYKPDKIIDTIKNGIIASIGISFSRGMIGLLLSFSSVVFLTIADLGNNIIKTNPAALDKIKIAIPYSQNADFSAKNTNNLTNQEQKNSNNANILDSVCKLYKLSQNKTPSSESSTIDLEKLLPSADDLSGPLTYFGYGIFRFNSIVTDSPFDPKVSANIEKLCGNLQAGGIPSDDDLGLILGNSTDRDIKDKLMSIMIMGLNVIVFSFALVVMIVANFLRVVFIRAIMAFSPLIILGRVFKQSFGEKADGMLGNIGAKSFASVIGLIFQPVVSIFGLCLAMFFINGMYSTFTRFQTDDEKGIASTADLKITETDKGSAISFGQGGSLSINGNFFNDSVGDIGGGLGYIMMSVILLYILFMIIKVSNSFNEATGRFTESIMKKGSEFIFNTKTPFFGGASIGAITGLDGRKDSLKSNFLKPYTDNLENNKSKDQELIKRKMSGFFGISVKDITAESEANVNSKLGKGKIDTKEENKLQIGLANEKAYGTDRVVKLNDLKKGALEGLNALRKAIQVDMKGEEFTFKTAKGAKKSIENRFLNGGAVFMKQAYGLEIKEDDFKDPEKLKKVLDGKNKVGFFINKMLTDEAFVKSFEEAKFGNNGSNKLIFFDSGAKIGEDGKKSLGEIKYNVQ